MKKLSLGKVKYFLKMIDNKEPLLFLLAHSAIQTNYFVHPSTHLLIQQLLIEYTKTRDFKDRNKMLFICHTVGAK